MVTIQRRTYSLADGRQIEIAFFGDEDRFRHTLTDHFLNASEPWERLLGAKFLRSARQKVDAGSVSIMGEAYDLVVPVLDAGIVFSIELPVYVEFRQERQPDSGLRINVSDGFYFLSEAGFLMVVREDRFWGLLLRTAWFEVGPKGPNQSKATLFRNAWQYVKKRSKGYRDSKGGEDVRHIQIVQVSPQNWERCPR